ncbi:interleukin-36 gamma-like [Dromiciops gliroides]|uniref:interleukin-36 gamma-like n=1 Tax=Dromiciops gliroides TaxID=33562 RepID=UPI001CC79184|nr:interleukin-36 gamma-like [Dromiciops gliroides]
MSQQNERATKKINVIVDCNERHKFQDYRILASPTPQVFHLQDSHQQVWALKDKTLIATPHSDYVTPVILESMPCRDKAYPVRDQSTAVYLGIHGKELCLFCEESGGKPTLKVKDKKIHDLYSSETAEKPFVFYVNKTGSISTIESAAYPGWFVCTSNEKDQPVTMTQHIGTNYNTAFYLSS